MRALTIMQPFAHLICLPDHEPHAKRVENRTWETLYRGPLLIHAGKSRQWLNLDSNSVDRTYNLPVDRMHFGFIVGVATLVECVRVEDLDDRIRQQRPYRRLSLDAMRWVRDHEHTHGPFGFVLDDCRRFPRPIRYSGAQGLFNVPEEVVAEQLEHVKAEAV